jgi:hypothetical protein
MSIFNFNNMPVSLIGDIQLTLLNNKTRDGSDWLTKTFFPREFVTSEKQLAIAELSMTAPIAPFVNPCVEGRPVRSGGSGKVSFVEFAYLKPKAAIEPCKVIDSAIMESLRQGGMSISQKMTDEQALSIDQIQKGTMLRKSIDNRVNLMCAEVFRTGKVIVMSDDQPRFEADYGRDPAANFVPAITWDLPASKPVQDIETMANLAFDLTGNYGIKLVMRTKVWKALVKHVDFVDTFIKPYGGIRNVLENTTYNTATDQANFKIKLDNGVEIWTYDGFYVDGAGVRQYYLPANYCGLVTGSDGVRAYGKIQDVDANFGAFKYYAKTWKNPDPSVIFMMVQSAPMVVPSHANMVIGGNGFVV